THALRILAPLHDLFEFPDERLERLPVLNLRVTLDVLVRDFRQDVGIHRPPVGIALLLQGRDYLPVPRLLLFELLHAPAKRLDFDRQRIGALALPRSRNGGDRIFAGARFFGLHTVIIPGQAAATTSSTTAPG